MTKKDLQDYRKLKLEVDQLNERIAEMWGVVTAPKITALTGMPHGSGVGDPVLAAVAKHRALVAKYAEKLSELNDRLLYVESCVDQLEPLQRVVIKYRYIHGMRWEDIEKKLQESNMAYEVRQIYRIHGEALARLRNIN